MASGAPIFSMSKVTGKPELIGLHVGGFHGTFDKNKSPEKMNFGITLYDAKRLLLQKK